MHCNLRPPDATSILIPLNYDVHAKFGITQLTSICCRLIAFSCWYFTLSCDLDLWLSTSVVNQLYRGQTLYQIWAPELVSHVAFASRIIFCQAIHSWLTAFNCCRYVMSRCDPEIWPLDLEWLWYIVCHVVIVCCKSERNWTISGWVINNLANFCPLVWLWPRPLTRWP